MRAIIFLAVLITECSSYKYLVYSPLFTHSHNAFINKLADILTEAGHDVTVLMPTMDVNLVNRTGLKTTKKSIILDPDPRADKIMRTTTVFNDVWRTDSSPMGLLNMVDTLSEMFGYTCEHVIKQTELLDKLKAEKFDAAIAEPFYFCGFGIFEQLGIETVISAFTNANADFISYHVGEPSAISSTEAAKGEQRSILTKIKNIMGTSAYFYLFNSIINAEEKALRQKYGEKFSGIAELLGRTSYSFVNANPYLDFPRPILSKTIFIGGIAVDFDNIDKLNKEWDSILSERPQTVLISFGSVAKSKDMPQEYKQQILEVIESLPDVTFIWKYEEPTEIGAHLTNLHFSKWVPQKALLADKRLSLFITHGGLASSTEIAYLGKPAIFIPLFGDQSRNAAMVARHGTAIPLPKEVFGVSGTLRSIIVTILEDKTYEEKARIFGEMLRNQPLNPKDLMIKHAEFAARFGPIKSLDPPARRLSIIEYYLLDVIALITGIPLLSSISILFMIRKCCCPNRKHKKD